MQYKNAGIRSKQTAARRLEEGEVFYHREFEIKYDKSYLYTSASPYRCGYQPLSSSQWDNHENWQVETQWQDHIPKAGTLCWVGNSVSKVEGHEEIDIITNWPYTESHPFESRENAYCYATPVKGEDLDVILHERQSLLA